MELSAAAIELSPVTSELSVMLLQLMGWEEEGAEKSSVRRKQEENNVIDIFFSFLFTLI